MKGEPCICYVCNLPIAEDPIRHLLLHRLGYQPVHHDCIATWIAAA